MKGCLEQMIAMPCVHQAQPITPVLLIRYWASFLLILPMKGIHIHAKLAHSARPGKSFATSTEWDVSPLPLPIVISQVTYQCVNSSSIGMVPVRVGGGSRASNDPLAMSLEQGTHVSMATLRAATNHQTPSHWPSQWGYLPTQYLPNPPMREGRGGRKSSTNIWFSARNKLHYLTWLECTTPAIREAPYVTSRCMSPWPPLTNIGLILT